MAAYLIYLPQAKERSNQAFKDVGLDSLVDGDAADFFDVIAQPPFDAQPGGLIATWLKGNPDRDPAGSFTSEQTWIPAKADVDRNLEAGRFWIGFEEERPLQPEDIEKKRAVLLSSPVILNDNNKWKVPVAARLPHVHGLDDEGRFARLPHARYRDFYNRAEHYMALFFQQLGMEDLEEVVHRKISEEDKIPKEVVVDLVPAFHYCCDALAMIYNIAPEIIAAFGLFDDSCMVNMIGATICMEQVMEVRDQKKRSAYLTIPTTSATWTGN